MFKKALLTTLLSLSTIATATINLDLNLTLKNQAFERATSGTVVVEENVPASVVFNGLEALTFSLLVNKEDDNAIIVMQIFQKTETDELAAVTNELEVKVPFGQPVTITINENSTDETSNGSLILTITPSLVE
jgi:hypothetical protein